MTTEMTAERRRYLLRATEDMVTAHRIEAITREHASIANLLDQREIFELDEIQIKQGKFVKIEADSRIQSRRGARAETEIKPVATQAVESFKEKGINVQLLSGGYDMELRVWKEKSSKPAYAEQRKFQYPELEDFLHKMTKEQKMEYKQKVGAAIIKLADKFREECKQLKADMDLNGIFHAEANAHRAHCIYLTMLHKHFSAKTIENPVLKEMYREEQKRRREEAARDEEKAQLLREMEERDRNAEKTRNRMMRRSMEMPHGSSLLGSPSTHATSAADTASRGQVSHDGDASTHASSKKKSKGGPHHAKAPPGKGPAKGADAKSSSLKSSSSSSLPAIQGALKVKTSSAELPSASSVVSSPQARKEKVQLEPPEKAFKRKLRQTVADGQVTNVFTQETQNNLLSGEVARLQQAEVVQFKRPKDRSDAWSESMSQWMLQDLQNKQVSRIAAGTVSNVGASLGSPMRQTSFSASSPTFAAAADTNASGAVYSINLGGENMTLQQQVTMDALALQRQVEQKEQWKAFGKAAVLAVDQFLAEQDDQRSGSPFHEQHHSPTGGMRGVYSPSRFVPFDEFYDILKKTSEPLLESALAVDDNVILPASLAATMQSATGVALSSAQLPSAAATSSSSSSPSHHVALKRAASMNAATMAHSVNPPPPLTSSLSVQHLPRMGSSSFLLDPQAAASSSSSTASPTNAAGANATTNGSGNGSGNGNGNVSSNNLNIVDVMRQTMEPRNFAAYEKVQDLTLPSAKLLARLNGTGGGASHRRLTSHLGAVGQTAIELRDSFGRLGRDANKGFDNMFSSQRMQEKGLLAHKDHRREDEANAVTFTNSTDGSGRGGASSSSTGGGGGGGGLEEDDPFMDHDDVVRRLERTGDVGERTRNGRMRASDMDAMLDKVTRTGANSNSNSNNKKKTATISVTDTTATTANDRLTRSRPTSRSSNATTPRRRHRAGVSRGSPSSPNSPHRALTPQNGSVMASPGGFGRNSPSSMGPRATSLDDDDDDNDDAYGDRADGHEDRVLHVPDDDLDLQHKLVATWDTLGVTANDRLAFMLKYSADVYAAEMSRSVDVWAGVAVCHVLLQRLMAVRDKAAQGLLLVPLSAKQIWRHVVRPLPALIRLNHEALIPPSLVFAHHHDGDDGDNGDGDSQRPLHDEDHEFSEAALARRRSRPLNKPYSVYLLARIQHMLGAVFAKHADIATRDAVWHPQVLTDTADAIDVTALSSFHLQQWHVDDQAVAQRLIRDLLRQAVRMQQRLLLRCRAEFDDEIPCGHNRYCRDFLQNVVNQLERDEAVAAGTL